MKFKSYINKLLLSEGFGFDYRIPKDKNELIYDFYALSLPFSTGKDETGKVWQTDDDLEFSMKLAKKENMKAMQDFMSQALRRAVSAEIYHFQPFWDKGKEKLYLEENPEWKHIYKKIKKKINPNDSENYSRSSLPTYGGRFEDINSLKIDNDNFYKFAENIFGQGAGSWHSSYGGTAWKKIATGGIRLSSNPESPIWIDHAIDLAHNTGSIFTKWESADVKNATLENKKYINTLKEYIDYVSPQLQDALRSMTRHDKDEPKTAPYKKQTPNYEVTITKKKSKTRKAREEEIDTFVENMLKYAFNMRVNKRNKAAVKGIIDTQLDSIDWNPDATNNLSEIEMLDGYTSDWGVTFSNTLADLEDVYGIKRNSEHNKQILINFIEWIDKEGVNLKNRQKGSELKRALLRQKWEFDYQESYDKLIRKSADISLSGRKDFDFDYIKKWLDYHYRADYKEFLKFKRNFISDLKRKTITVYDPTGKKISKKDEDYINELVSDAEKKGYSKQMKKERQPELKLDSVNNYLNKKINMEDK